MPVNFSYDVIMYSNNIIFKDLTLYAIEKLAPQFYVLCLY